MSLRWDPLLVRHLARELDALLAGARLRALRLDGRTRDLTLLFRERTLLWRLHPTRGHLALHPPVAPARGDLPLAARVRTVRAPEDERILTFELLSRGRATGGLDLVVELLGNQWNAVVVEVPGGRVRHVLVRRGGARPLAAGGTYRPPPPAGREGVAGDPATVSWPAAAGGPAADLERRLVATVAWTSPLNAGPLLAAEDGPALWARLADPEAPPDPHILEISGDLQPYPFPLPGVPGRRVVWLLEAFGEAAREAAGGGAPAPGGAPPLPPELAAGLERAHDEARRRVRALERERDAREDPAALRSAGDLLLARLDRVPRGVPSVRLPGFDGVEVTVELDPTLAPHANAAAYYARAGRAERAAAKLPALLARARARLARLQEAARTGAPTPGDLERLRSLLPGADAPPRTGAEPAPLPYRTYRSSGGLEIRVGRGPRANDELTFRHSAPGDVWLHARQAPGAHVILRWGRPGAPPARDLAEAATLAALHSRARTSGSVLVAWTFRRYVRKPRKAPPGTVVPERVRTVWVEPDPAVEERLGGGRDARPLPSG